MVREPFAQGKREPIVAGTSAAANSTKTVSTFWNNSLLCLCAGSFKIVNSSATIEKIMSSYST
jgi:hypothetical protein